MRAITIRQPWPFAIMELGEDVENREWFSTLKGDVAIHTAIRCGKREYEEARDFIQSHVGIEAANSVPAKQLLPLGQIIGVVEILGCVRRYDSPWFVGKFGFVLQNPRYLSAPIEIAGQLKFWEVPGDVENEIRRQVGHIRPTD